MVNWSAVRPMACAVRCSRPDWSRVEAQPAKSARVSAQADQRTKRVLCDEWEETDMTGSLGSMGNEQNGSAKTSRQNNSLRPQKGPHALRGKEEERSAPVAGHDKGP